MTKLSQKYHSAKSILYSSDSYLLFHSFQHYFKDYFKDHYSSVKNVENVLSACITIALSNTECYTLKK